MKLVHSRTDAPCELPDEWRGLIEKLREMAADIEAEPIPARFRELLGLDDPDQPPPAAPGQRIARFYDDRAEETEAAERRLASK